MADPITTTIAAALATGATGALSDGVRVLITKLASLVRERLRRAPSDQDALDAAVQAPGDAATRRRLAEALEREMRRDPAFADQVRLLWTEVAAAEAEDRAQVVNTVNGPVHGSVLQAREVHGGVSFQSHPRPPPPP